MKNIQNYLLLIFSCIMLFCCGKEETEHSENGETSSDTRIFISKEQWKANQFDWVQISEKWFPNSIQASGKIDAPPQSITKITVPAGGYIRDFYFLEGEYVRKGQKLLSIENPDFLPLQKEYAQWVKETAFLQKEYERKKQLAEEKIIARKSLLEIESTWQQAKTRKAALAKQLTAFHLSPQRAASGSFTTQLYIYAPNAGYVTDIKGVKGSYVSPTEEILTLIDNKHLHLELNVYEKDISTIKKGQRILFTVPEVSSDTLKGVVKLIDAKMGENRKIRVHGHFEPNNLKLMVGMYIDAQIIIDSIHAPALPTTSFVQQENHQLVLALSQETKDGYYLKPIPVKRIRSYQGFSMLKNDSIAENTFLRAGGFQILP